MNVHPAPAAPAPDAPQGKGRIAVAAYRRLLVLRGCAIAVQFGVLVVAVAGLGMAVPLRASLAVLVAQAATVLLGALWPVRAPLPQWVYGAHLGLDIAGLTALFHLNGGYANPFAFSYLMPLALAATVLDRAPVLALSALAVAGYATVGVWYRPMAHYHGALGGGFDLHLAGMAAGFLLGTAVIVAFVLPAAQAGRRRAEALARAQARAARDAEVVALGALLAGSAHALATPLGSALLLADELVADAALAPPGGERLALLRDQLAECKRSLSRALAAAADPHAVRVRLPAGEYLTAVARRFRTQRPDTALAARWPAGAGPVLDLDDRVDQLLLSVLHNAADTGARVRLVGFWDARRLHVAVRDHGPGLGALPVGMGITSKPHGHGLGLFLARAVAQRLGGELAVETPRGGGTRVRVTLPLRSLPAGA